MELSADGPCPVEFKVGRRRGPHAELQLCAQALCLEEMLGRPVRRGAIYYHAERKRYEIPLDDELRARTVAAIEAVRAMLREQLVPDAPNDTRCRDCSLQDACLPGVVADAPHLRGLQGALFVPYPREGEDGGDEPMDGAT